VKATMEIRTKAVVFYDEAIRSAREIGETYNISERTVRLWAKAHRQDKENGLRPKKTGPKRSPRATSPSLEQRIIRLKEKYPAWGARRIKHQFNLPCSWRTVHRILKKHGLLIRINKAKPQPAGKRFQRQHVDSMWQGDTFQFRIRGVDKVYVTGFPIIVHAIALKARSTCTKMLPQRSMPYNGHFVMDESQEKSTSIMGNNLSLKHSKQNLKNTVLN
jgi:transposase